MIVNKEDFQDVNGADLRKGWDEADDTPGEICTIPGTRICATKGQIALELNRRKKPGFRRGGWRRVPRSLSDPTDYSAGMAGFDVGIRIVSSKR